MARSPISLVEVQGYAYVARKAMADLMGRAGDKARAGELRFTRPMLPEFLDWLGLRGVLVGRARADFRLERHGGGVRIRVLTGSLKMSRRK